MNAVAALFGLLLQFHQVPVPEHMASPQKPTFALAGFAVHEDADDTDVELPQYLSTTEANRAAALIRFAAPVTGLCNAYEVSTLQADGTVHRIGPLRLMRNPYPEDMIPVRAGTRVKAMVALYNADDIRSQHLPLSAEHRTIGVVCVRASDGEIFYSQLYGVEPGTMRG